MDLLQSFKVQIAHHGPMAMASMASMAALLAGDGAARARAYVALSAGASLEEVEEARHLAEDVQTEQVTGRMARDGRERSWDILGSKLLTNMDIYGSCMVVIW